MAKYSTEEAPLQWWRILATGSDSDSRQARNDLILHYQFLVTGTARKFKRTLPSWITDDDLISYGQSGLIKAVDRYDPDQGPFKRFASTFIHGAIVDELRSQDWAPRGLRRDQRAISEATQQLGTGDSTPSLSQVAQHLGWESARLESTLRRISNAQHQSLDGVDVLSAEDDLDGQSRERILLDEFVDYLETLPEVEQLVMVRRYFLGEPLTTVASQVSLPLSVVSRIHAEITGQVFRVACQALQG